MIGSVAASAADYARVPSLPRPVSMLKSSLHRKTALPRTVVRVHPAAWTGRCVNASSRFANSRVTRSSPARCADLVSGSGIRFEDAGRHGLKGIKGA